MNLNTSEASPTTLTGPPLGPLNLMQENQVAPVSPLEPIIQQLTPFSTSLTGEPASNPVLMPLETQLSPKTEVPCATPSSSLKSNVKPHELLEKQVEPRVLKVSQSDLDALCQVVTEFKEQFVG